MEETRDQNPPADESEPHDAAPATEPPGPPEPAEPPEPPPLAPSSGFEKSPILAAILSGFPGMGNIYNGLYLRGIAFFAVIFTLILLADRGHEIFGFAVAFAWIFNIVDAYRQANLINYGYATDLGIGDRPRLPRPGQGALWAGIALIVIGVLGGLDVFFDIDIDRVLDLWPLGLLAAGIWLVIAALRQRQAQSES